jgi:hypothetical protein
MTPWSASGCEAAQEGLIFLEIGLRALDGVRAAESRSKQSENNTDAAASRCPKTLGVEMVGQMVGHNFRLANKA